MIILRHATKPEFVYAQGANFWNPPDAVRDEMRAAARNVGVLLQERLGYLGGFGIDGVCTRNGFLPTELNPRLSIGHGLQSRSVDIPLATIERMVIEEDLDVDARDLEDTIVSAVTMARSGGTLVPLTGAYDAAKTGIRFDGSEAVAVEAGREERRDHGDRTSVHGFDHHPAIRSGSYADRPVGGADGDPGNRSGS